MKRNRWGWIGAVLLALVLVPALASAQATQVGQLAGEVKDATGGILPGATVTLTSVERGFSRIAVTDTSGKFLFAVVPIGRYAVNVKMPSFQTLTLTDNLVEAERTTTVSVTLKVAGVEVATTVVGETPIVDAKNQTLETRLRVEEFSKLAVGRSYLSLTTFAPGVVGPPSGNAGNMNSHGALTSNNIFMFDGVNTTDTTTGTFGTNLNFEAIQEMVVRTSSVGVEYGRGTGATVDVITKSGTNRFEGAFKYLVSNDDWNKQNSTKNEITGASLERVKFNQNNNRYVGTLGGPIIKDRAWFFFTYEDARLTSPSGQTNADVARGFANQEFTQVTKSPWYTFRISGQLAPNHNVFVKYGTNPTDGFINDYWATATGPHSAELQALTSQNQGGTQLSGNYNGVLGTKWAASAMVAHSTSTIDVVPYNTTGVLDGGAPYMDQVDGRFYNGATFDGTVSRPRTQASGSMEYFTKWMSNDHAVKFGVDWQGLESEAEFKYPTNKVFYVTGFNPDTRALCPGFTAAPNCATRDFYEEYDAGPSISNGNQVAFFIRDKFQLGPRLSVEGGIRLEKQTGTSDVGAGTVDTTDISPRISASYALTSDSKTIIVGSAGRFFDSILQGFSDAFASVPQQETFSSYKWDGTQYVFDFRLEQGASAFKPNLDVSPRHMDEVTVGLERQLNNQLGIGARFIYRTWGNFIDDIRTFNADGTASRVVTNVDAERTYKGLEFTADKRFANNWAASGSYSWSQARGNHFGDNFTTLGDYVDGTCAQTTDSGLGTASGSLFVFPCSELQANLFGVPAYDRPHMLKFMGSYRQPIGPVDLTAGFVGLAASKQTYSKSRTVSVLFPGTTSVAIQQTYLYEGLGSDRIGGSVFTGDFSLEASYRANRRTDFGVKFETFNLFNNEEKIAVNNTSWCNATTAGACTTARTNFGTGTARASFLAPTTFRLTFLVRF